MTFLELARDRSDDETALWHVRPARPEPPREQDEVWLSSFADCLMSPMHRIRTSTLPAGGVNLRLLLTRLQMTCRIRC